MKPGAPARSCAVPISEGTARSRSFQSANFHFTEAWFPPGSVLEPHTHDRAIFAVMVKGGFRTAISHRELDCATGCAWTEPLAERHANFVSAEGARVVVIQPDWRNEELLGPFARLLDEVHLLRQANFMIEAQRIAGEIGTRDNLSALCADALAMMLLSGATRSKYREENGNRPPPWLLRARDLLNDEWRNTVRLTDVAREVGVHPAHLARTFSAYFGESIGSYLRKLRLNWALAQLTARDGPIAPVALEAGFSDQSHFTRECRRHMGVTPAAYRARAVANAE